MCSKCLELLYDHTDININQLYFALCRGPTSSRVQCLHASCNSQTFLCESKGFFANHARLHFWLCYLLNVKYFAHVALSDQTLIGPRFSKSALLTEVFSSAHPIFSLDSILLLNPDLITYYETLSKSSPILHKVCMRNPTY